MNQCLMRILLSGIIIFSTDGPEFGNTYTTEKHGLDHSHSRWTSVLKKYVSNQGDGTQITYEKLAKTISEFETYLKELESVTLENFRTFNREQQLAFLINAYNAFTVKLILDHYPVKSIKEIGGLFSSPWKKTFFTLLGAKRHLDSIEHGMIRQDAKALQELEPPLRLSLAKFNEPRIHFAVNCASKSCPALRNEAYIAKNLNEQLEDAARHFINNHKQNRYDAASSGIYLSSIFKWYGADFENGDGSVLSFVATRMATTLEEERTMKRAKISFLDYDWSLNGE